MRSIRSTSPPSAAGALITSGVDIVQNRIGEELRLIPPLLVQKANHRPLLRIGWIEPDSKFAWVLLIKHYHHLPFAAY